MEKQSQISARQLIVLMIMLRLPFSTAYYIALNAGQSIQDILFAVPVNFVLNFIVAIPVLILLKKHPGKDPVELANDVFGKAGGIVTGTFYMFCFILLAIYMMGNFQDFYVNAIIPESSYLAIALPMLFVALYGAVKGIEAIARFGSIVIMIYLIILSIITLSLLPRINFSYLFPAFYNGPGVFLNAVLSGYNQNFQIVFLLFCAPFLKSGTGTGKLFSKWNIISSLLYLALEFLTVTVMGPFAGRQKFPLSTLAMQSRLGVFERIETVDMISWILNAILIITVFIHFAVSCLLKMGLNKYRKPIAFLVAAAVFVTSMYVTNCFLPLHAFTLSPVTTLVTTVAVIFLPFLILMTDLIKRRVAGNEKAD